MDTLSGGLLVFLVALLGALLSLGGFVIAVCRGARKERRLRRG
ncbi:MAG: hypothetical protein QOI44_2622 [Actinomycetota bacterium]|nr:hypothetical protein [Actinomycetota bacterium]